VIFQSRLALVKTTVDKALAGFFIRKKQEAKKIDPYCVALVDQVESLTMRGGKRTRAFLCWLGAQAVSCQLSAVSPKLLSAMMALELFHSFALIHDDIIDEDTTRRGAPSVHEHFRINASKHFGTSMAILTGDLALVWADELMGRVKSQKSKVKSEDIYQAMKQEVIFGQSLDVMEEHMKIGISKQLIDVYKTAWYSVIRPLQIGAAIAGAGEKMLDSFIPYGLAVGQAYQLRDDVLDGTITESDFMKQVKHLTIPRSATPMLQAFARFAIERNA